MSRPGSTGALAMHLALLSSVSFGGIPSVLPDVHNYVAANGWVSDREFADFFAVAQALPGPNMILMMSFIGWKVGGLPAAVAAALATCGPPCAIYFAAFGLWDRLRDAPVRRILRAGVAPLTVGLILGSGAVMAHTADTGWRAVLVTLGAALALLRGRVNPIWAVAAGGALGGLGLL